MSAIEWIALVLAVGLAAYLFYALLNAEDF